MSRNANKQLSSAKPGEVISFHCRGAQSSSDDEDDVRHYLKGGCGITKVTEATTPEYAIKDGTPAILQNTADFVVVVKVLHVIRRDVKVD